MATKVCVIGLWHLGSVVSICLSSLGYKVVGYDRSKETVDKLLHNELPVDEPGLAEMNTKSLQTNQISFTNDPKEAFKGAEYIMVCHDIQVIGRNLLLEEIYQTSHEIALYADDGCTVIVCSQVIAGTTKRMEQIIKNHAPALKFHIGYSPDNLRLGKGVDDFLHPQVIIIGADDETTQNKMEKLYAPIQAVKVTTRISTAEMVKHGWNAFLGACISFANELAQVCEVVGANAEEVIKLMRYDKRFAVNLPLNPGLGFSGMHFERDIAALCSIATSSQTPFFDGVLKQNELGFVHLFETVETICSLSKNKIVAILGLTYKPNTNTLRGSMAIPLIERLISLGCEVRVYDPKAETVKLNKEQDAKNLLKRLDDPYSACSGADFIVIMTPWDEFRSLDLLSIKNSLTTPLIVDPCNILDIDKVKQVGFTYFGTGRKVIIT